MSREAHVRFCEGLGVRFPRATHPYVRLRYEFVYLAMILDAFSRRSIGWALSRWLDTQLTLAALRMAVEGRNITGGLVHHSDQGVQYAAHEYVDLLKSQNITISMSRRGNPYDNAIAESFMKTLKHEEVYMNEYNDFEDAFCNLREFIEKVYNQKRLHSSLGYMTPVEFEEQYVQQKSLLTVENCVSF